MRFIELFAGIGGFRYGLEAVNRKAYGGSQEVEENGYSEGHPEPEGVNAQRGRSSEHGDNRRCEEQFTCVYANEFDKYAAQIYEKNYEKPDTRDIREVKAEEIPDHDLLTAGFPCQAFSIAGKRGGFEDTRGTLFFEIARILKAKRPKYLLLENVKGLLSSKTPVPFNEFLLIFSEEAALKENIKCTDFVPIKSWEILAHNLAQYLNKTSGLDGLIGRLKNLKTQTEQIMRKPENLCTELMRLYECKEEEWDSLLNLLSSKEGLKAMDIFTLEKAMVINGDAVLKLRKRLGVSLNPMKLSTTLTELKLTTDQRTYMFAIQELSIILFIIKQWKLSTSLWDKIRLFSKKEGIYYVKTFNIILHELSELGYDLQWQVLNSKDFGVPQNRERVFIIGHLRGTSRPEVFPIGEGNREDNASGELRARQQLPQRNEYRAIQEEKEETGSYRVRRLTPTECERLQGFPDGWTEGISDTQRYKCLGNAVTTSVVTAIGERLL